MKLTALLLTVILLTVVLGTAIGQIPTFTDIAPSAGVNNSDLSLGAAFLDINNDGYDDIHLINDSQPYDYDHIYLNLGNLVFQDITREAGVKNPPFSNSVRIMDFNNDGWQDLMITTSNGPEGSRLYCNNGDNTFTDIFPNTGIVSQPYAVSDWADINNDGWIDIYLLSLFSQQFDNLWFSSGTARYIRAANTGGDFAFGCDAQFCDLDNDGDLDLLQGVYGFNRLFENQSQHFREIGAAAGIAGEFWDFSHPLIADFNNDGKFDVFVLNNEEYVNSADCLYRQDQPMLFSNVINLSGIAPMDYAICGVWGDFDNDGWVDLLTFSYNGLTRFWHNNGNETFTDVAEQAGINISNSSPQGVAIGDINSDGFLDFYLVRYDSYRPPNRLYLNEGNNNHWLDVSLNGTASNRLGIGARVKAVTGDLIQWRDVGEGNYSTCSNAQRIHLGFGSNTLVDSIYIYWPSGGTDILTNIEVDQRLVITEGSSIAGNEITSTLEEELLDIFLSPNPFNQQTVISYKLQATSHMDLTVYDIVGREVAKLVDGYQNAGNHEVIFDAKDLVSGVYFVRLTVDGGQSMVQKVVLMK